MGSARESGHSDKSPSATAPGTPGMSATSATSAVTPLAGARQAPVQPPDLLQDALEQALGWLDRHGDRPLPWTRLTGEAAPESSVVRWSSTALAD